MSVQFNHTIVRVRDKQESATFLAEILGLPAPTPFGPFLVVQVDNDVSLDFADDHGPANPQHYAFLVSESGFDEIFGRIRERGLPYWADPFRPDQGDQHQRRRSRGVLGRPERPFPRDHHPPVRQRRLTPSDARRRGQNRRCPGRTRYETERMAGRVGVHPGSKVIG